jgi:hypothetical protein
MGIDVVYNKVQIIECCLKRIDEEYQGNPENLENNTKQDSIILTAILAFYRGGSK